MNDQDIREALDECGFVELPPYQDSMVLAICAQFKLVPRWDGVKQRWSCIVPSVAGPSLATLLALWPLVPNNSKLEYVRRWMEMMVSNGIPEHQVHFALIVTEVQSPEFVAEITRLLDKEMADAN